MKKKKNLKRTIIGDIVIVWTITAWLTFLGRCLTDQAKSIVDRSSRGIDGGTGGAIAPSHTRLLSLDVHAGTTTE